MKKLLILVAAAALGISTIGCAEKKPAPPAGGGAAPGPSGGGEAKPEGGAEPAPAPTEEKK